MKFKSQIELEALNNATSDTDKFLVSDGGVVKFRTGSQLLSDLGVSNGYVPYVGATANVNLGSYGLTSTTLNVNKNSGNGDAVVINKGGSGNALVVNKNSGSGHAALFNGGNVGIWTTSPNSELTVNGTVEAINSNSGNFRARHSLTHYADYFTGKVEFNGPNQTYSFVQNGQIRLKIDPNGNVGIGVLYPNNKLEIDGNIKLSETAATIDTDKFAVLDDGVIKYRTGVQVLSDIGGAQSSEIYTINEADSIFTSKTFSKNISFGESYASNYRSRVLDNGGTFYPRPLGYEIGLMKEQDLFNKASLCLLPSGVGSGKVYNIKPKNNAFNFTRNSEATYVDEDGLIAVADVNVPRLDYSDGDCPSLLLEPQRTNLITYSEAFDNGSWGKDGSVTITPNFSISPDGTQNAERFQKTATVGNEGITQNIFGLLAGTYTLTFYLKSNTNVNQNARLLYGGFQSSEIVITPNWERFQITYTANTSVDYNGILSNEALDISIYGAQVEQGSYPTSYIPTNGNSVTRSADSSSQTPPSGVIGRTEGTILFDYTPYDVSVSTAQDTIPFALSFEGSSGNAIFLNDYNGNLNLNVNVGGVAQSSISFGSLVAGQTFKIGIGYASNVLVYYVNGVQIGIDTSLSLPTCNQIKLNGFTSNVHINKINVNDFKLYNTRLLNSELAALTS